MGDGQDAPGGVGVRQLRQQIRVHFQRLDGPTARQPPPLGRSEEAGGGEDLFQAQPCGQRLGHQVWSIQQGVVAFTSPEPANILHPLVLATGNHPWILKTSGSDSKEESRWRWQDIPPTSSSACGTASSASSTTAWTRRCRWPWCPSRWRRRGWGCWSPTRRWCAMLANGRWSSRTAWAATNTSTSPA